MTSLAQHIKELEYWIHNRQRAHLDVRVLENALQLAKHQQEVNQRRMLRELPAVLARACAEHDIYLFTGGDRWQPL